jgi:hypothetical protein
VTPELRAALRLVAESHPAGASVPVLREHLLDLLDGTPTTPAVEGDLTCRGVGAIIGRHDSTVRAMCERGELPGAYRHHGREWRVPAAAVRTYQASQRAGAGRRRHATAKPSDLGAWRKLAS